MTIEKWNCINIFVLDRQLMMSLCPDFSSHPADGENLDIFQEDGEAKIIGENFPTVIDDCAMSHVSRR